MAFFRNKTVVDPDAPEFPHTRQVQAYTHNHESKNWNPHRHLVGRASRYLNCQTGWGIVQGDHIHEAED